MVAVGTLCWSSSNLPTSQHVEARAGKDQDQVGQDSRRNRGMMIGVKANVKEKEQEAAEAYKFKVLCWKSCSRSLEDERGIEKIYVDPLNAPYFDLPMIDDFATAANKARRPVCDGFTGYRVQAVVDAAFESHKTGKRISVETITT